MERLRRKRLTTNVNMHEDFCAAGHGHTARSVRPSPAAHSVRKTTEHLKFMFRKRSRSAARGMAYSVFCIYIELGDENCAMDEWYIAEQSG
jgi:hypothetical protein